MFSGHAHSHERFTGMYNGAPSTTGTVYITVGSGGIGPSGYGAFPPYVDKNGIRWTMDGTRDCVNRVTVGAPNPTTAPDTDCCNSGAKNPNGDCWPAGTQGANPTYTPPTAANNYNGLYTDTYLQASKFRTDFFNGYGTLALINKDVAQWQYFPVTQAIQATASATYQGPVSQPIPASFGITAANPSVDRTLICNTVGQYGSVNCPSSVTFVSTAAGAGPLPAAPTVTVVLTAQRVDGVTAAAAATAGFQLNYVAAQAKVLNVPATSIAVTGITTPTSSSSRFRHLLQNSVVVNTAVTSPQNAAAINAALAAAVANGAFTNALQSQGVTGATATAPPASVTPVTPAATTPAATAAPANSISSSSPSCFAATETVSLENGATKAIAEVRVGDRILAADVTGKAVFSDVVAVPHGPNAVETTFTVLTTAAGRSVQMTANHVLPAGACDTAAAAAQALPLVRADQVAAGQCVMTAGGPEQVVSVEERAGRGVYTVVTGEAYIVVNGIVASPYGGINPTVAHVYYNLHRLAYAVAPRALLLASQAWVEAAMNTVAAYVL